jgi:3'-5' exoribonuclease
VISLKQLARDLRKGMQVDSDFLVLESSLRPFQDSSRKGFFLSLVLGDSSGQVNARAWENVEGLYSNVPKGSVATFSGKVEEYKGELQVILESALPKKDFDALDFLPKCKGNPEEMLSELREKTREFKNPFLKKLFESLFSDESFCVDFKRIPAAKLHHDSCVGGLLEHTLKVFRLCEDFAEEFPELDRELLLSGATLHDIGKVKAYELSPQIEITTEGGLVGHIGLGDEILLKEIERIPGFPEELKLKLRHLIASHQMKLEWGSPITPKFPEAAALACADYAAATIREFITATEEEREKSRDKGKNGSGSEWSSFRKSLDRFIYLK